jgi:hypothetical protein
MSIEALILSHAGIAAAAIAATAGYLRHVAGWRTSFEATIAADIAHLRSLLHLSSLRGVPSPPQAVGDLPSGPLTAAPIPPIGAAS